MDPNNEENDLVLIRHAQSRFNQGYTDYIAENNLTLQWEEVIQLPHFNENVSYHPKFIDCSLSPEGILQCEQARKSLIGIPIDLVIVSPQLRALETCRAIFGGQDAKVIVNPLFMQVFRYSCDISNHMENKKAQFASYDFSAMDNFSELWFIEHLHNRHQQECQAHLEKQQAKSFAEKQKSILELVSKKIVYETDEELRERSWLMKEALKTYREKHNKIALVSHYHVIQVLLAEGFGKASEVLNPVDTVNAKPYWRNLAKLLKIR